MKNVLPQLVNYCNNSGFDDTYHQIAEILISNFLKISDLTIFEISEMCFTSPATFGRFCRKLGYRNYQDFSGSLEQTITDYEFLNRNVPTLKLTESENITDLYFDHLIGKITELKDNINKKAITKITDAIFSSKAVYFYSPSDSGISSFQQDIIMTGKKALLLKDTKDQMSNSDNLDLGCVVIMIFAQLREMTDMLEPLEAAKKHGAKCVVIESSLIPPTVIQKNADFILSFDGTKTTMDGYFFEIYLNLLKLDYRSKFFK